MAGLVAGVVLGDGHGGGGSHQSQYGGGGGGGGGTGGGGETAYSSYASGAQDAFNQLGETIPGSPGEDFPILAEVRLVQILLLTPLTSPLIGSKDFLPVRWASGGRLLCRPRGGVSGLLKKMREIRGQKKD